MKLADFFGVNQSEIEIRELRKLLDNIETDDQRDMSEVDSRKSKGSGLSIQNFLKKKVIPETPILFQVRSSIDVDVIGKKFKGSIQLKPYRFRFVTYQNCFSGKDAVDWFCVNSVETGSIGRLEAVALGNLLFQKGLFFHIQRKHDFQDKMFYYQFVEGVAGRPASGVPDGAKSVLMDIAPSTIKKEGWLLRYDDKKKEWKRVFCSVENMTLDMRNEPPPKSPSKLEPPTL